MRTTILSAYAMVLIVSSVQISPAQTTIKVGTRLVEVDVVVRDKNGPVRGLSQADFELLDRGKPQKIALFGESQRPSTPAQTTPLAPNVASNRIDRAGAMASNVTAILLDRLNTATEDQVWADRQVLRVLQTLQPGDRVALYTLGKSVRIIADFTLDPEKIRAALAKLGPEQSVDLAASDVDDPNGLFPDSQIAVANFDVADPETQRQFNQALKGAASGMREAAMLNRIDLTGKGMEMIAHHLAGVPGRKNLVWISAAFPMSFEFRERGDATTAMGIAIRALNDAAVAVYPMDARGLRPDAAFAAQNASGNTGIAATRFVGVGPSGVDTMLALARATGGKAFYNTNDLMGSLRVALEDEQFTYILGFYPNEASLDDKFHELRVKLSRQGGSSKDVDIRSRTTYFAGNAPESSEKERHKELLKALSSPMEATALGLAAAVSPVPDSPGKYVARLSLNMSDLQPQPQGDQWIALVDVAALTALPMPGKLRIESLSLKFTQAQWLDAVRNGYIIELPFSKGAEPNAIRLAVQDRSTGLVGSLTLPVR